MTSKEALSKIANLLSLNRFNFSTYTSKEGAEFRVGEMMVGEEIYVITPEGELPAPDGDYQFEDGMEVKVKDGLIQEMQVVEVEVEKKEEDEMPEEYGEKKMTEATLVDGTKITNDSDMDFEVGQKLFVITEEGTKVPAPEGEHTTESGIVVVVDAEGVITGLSKPDGEEEGSLDMSLVETIEAFSSALEKMMNRIDSMEKKFNSLNTKFSAFSAEPAGEKVYDRKGYVSQLKEEKFSKLDALYELRKTINK